ALPTELPGLERDLDLATSGEGDATTGRYREHPQQDAPRVLRRPAGSPPSPATPLTHIINGAATKNRPASAARTGYSGGGIRTRDLRVMSPTSYQAAPPRDKDTKNNQKSRPGQVPEASK